ncbi:MAG: hypothetical protein PHU25_17005 [Deltaproteobacteria bacterium]|nr:hypothetical protein [Deltaproteobacteria bacterium]
MRAFPAVVGLVLALSASAAIAAPPAFAPAKEAKPAPGWFDAGRAVNLGAVVVFAGLFLWFVRAGRKGRPLHLRPIAGLSAIDDAVGRAAEMGRPILFSPGLSDIGHPSTLASMGLLSKVAERAARLRARIIVPNYSPLVFPVTQSVVRAAFLRAGRPQNTDLADVSYLTSRSFTYAAAVAGSMVRERTASNFLFGHFFSEALILAETGASTGAVQIGGTDSDAQLPFFITTCDYTLIGEELFAAAAMVSGDPVSRSTIKAHDAFKVLIVACILLGLALSLAGVAGVDVAAELAARLAASLRGAGR